MPFAPNKYWAFPILVRMYRKRQTNQRALGKGGKLERKQTGQATAKQYRTRPELALEMIQLVASWIPQRTLRVLGDSEYAGQSISRHLPANVKLISRMNMKAALFEPAGKIAKRGRPHGGTMWPNDQSGRKSMSIESEWAERFRRRASEYDVQATGHRLIHRDNFNLFIAIEEVASWQQFHDVIAGRFQRRGWAFRGHGISDWPLQTSLERACLRTLKLPGGPPNIGPTSMFVRPDQSERDLLLQFQRQAHHYIQNPPDDSDVLDWLALMQHHGVPTRLLDWTFSPYVALYFALEKSDNSPSDADCAVWAVDTPWLTEKANNTLAADPQFPKPPNVRTFDQYLNRCLDDILFGGTNFNVVVVANPIKMNERVAAQQGVFLCHLSRSEAFDYALLQMMLTPMLPTLPVIWKV